MKFKSSLVALILTAPLMFCSAPKTSTEPQKVIDEFFQTYKSTGHREAVTTLLLKNKWITTDDANSVASKMDELVSQIGTYYGTEKIGETSYGQSFVEYTYVVRYERQPLKFIFKFYKPNDKWQMQSFNYEVDFSRDFDSGRSESN